MREQWTLPLRLVCRELPGLRFEDRVGSRLTVREPVHLAMQCGDALEGVVPADAHEVVFEPALTVVEGKDGVPDFRGPQVFGRRGGRFLYLVWLTPAEGGEADRFRRAKVGLEHLDRPALERARAAGGATAHLRLTDARGGPLCATVPAEHLRWEP